MNIIKKRVEIMKMMKEQRMIKYIMKIMKNINRKKKMSIKLQKLL